MRVLSATWLVLSLLLAGRSSALDFPVFPANGTLLLGIMGHSRFGPPFRIEKLGSAAQMAVDEINANETILPDYELSFTHRNDRCSAQVSLGECVSLVVDAGVMAVIGPSCSGAAESTGELVSYWNLPMIGYSGRRSSLSDKKVLVLVQMLGTRGFFAHLELKGFVCELHKKLGFASQVRKF